MAVDFLRRVRKKLTNHVLAFAEQTVLGGPKYFLNRGTIGAGQDITTGKEKRIKISRFDRLVG